LLVYAPHHRTLCARLPSTWVALCASVCPCGTGYRVQGAVPSVFRHRRACEPRWRGGGRGAFTPERPEGLVLADAPDTDSFQVWTYSKFGCDGVWRMAHWHCVVLCV